MTRCLRKTLLALSFSIVAVTTVAVLGEPVQPILDAASQSAPHATNDRPADSATARRMHMTLPYIGRVLHREEH